MRRFFSFLCPGKGWLAICLSSCMQKKSPNSPVLKVSSCLCIERNCLIYSSFSAINAWYASLLSSCERRDRKLNRCWTLFSHPSQQVWSASMGKVFHSPSTAAISTVPWPHVNSHKLEPQICLSSITPKRHAVHFMHRHENMLLSSVRIADGKRENLDASRIEREIDDWIVLCRGRNWF